MALALSFVQMSFLSTDIYVQAKRSWMSLVDLKTEREVSSSTLIALPLRERGRPELVSDINRAETAAARGAIELLDGFGHDRVFVGDFEAAEYALKLLLKRVKPAWWRRVDHILFHVQREMAGGLTEVEKRAIRDLCLYVGAKHVRLYLKPTTLSLRDVRRLLKMDDGREPHLTY